MTCPYCQSPLADPPPRFCDACGLAQPRVRHPAEAKARRGGAAAAEPVRCGECGVEATSRRCRACGARVHWPEDKLPPDEETGRPPAPSLELPDDGGGDLDVD